MKTFVIHKEFRLNTHFYSQLESGRKIKMVFDNDKCYKQFKTMFTLDLFDLFCIQSYSYRKIQRYNLYKNCKVLETGTIKPDLTLKGINTYEQPYIMFQCEKIIMDIPEDVVSQRIRKEKLTTIKQLTV